MLRLKKITKDYKIADYKVEALKGVSLAFRKNELVSILGPSGCGKTTLLNIIGGLDKYTTGDLYIGGISTKEFKDRDWDVYRNHRIGFIFQSYNLIPHQTVLSNVELALSISGLKKEVRVKKAKEALDKVGLSDQYSKKPTELSGGQCQRVAIARSLVNDPEILLADEPTGALDTENSNQIMNIIKEIAKERLVIMVTHNRELAEEYSTRIVDMLDGLILKDSNPYPLDAEEKEVRDNGFDAEKVKKEKAKMSFSTAFFLSLKNLLSKKRRTILTAIASSIGIIGVSLVLAVSYGVRSYITNMQDDMLSGNPVQINEQGSDISSLLGNMGPSEQRKTLVIEDGKVNVNSTIERLAYMAQNYAGSAINNNITQEYVDYIMSLPSDYVAAVYQDFGIDVSNNIFTDFHEKINVDGTYDLTSDNARKLALSAVADLYQHVMNQTDYAQYSNLMISETNGFQQAPANENYILQQYELLDGVVATKSNELMLVLTKSQEINDVVLAQLGFYSQNEVENIIYSTLKTESGAPHAAYNQDLYDYSRRISYDFIRNKVFTYYPNNSIYTANVPSALDATSFKLNVNDTGTFENGFDMKIVGILKPKDDINYGSLSNGFYYTEAFTRKFLEDNLNSELTSFLRNSVDGEGNPATNISSGRINIPGTSLSTEIGINYQYEINVSLRDASGASIGTEYNHALITGYVGQYNTMLSMLDSFTGGAIGSLLGDSASLKTFTLRQSGGIKVPNAIAIYPVNFDLKDKVLESLDKWNNEGSLTFLSTNPDGTKSNKLWTYEDRVSSQNATGIIKYQDNIGLIIGMVNTLIDIVTTALIAFTSLALIVSCVMIAIITFVSVLERIKEIGTIRSLGGRKRDVSNLFNAETFIIGLASGILAIIVTYIGTFVINVIISHVNSSVGNMAIFPWFYAVLMLALSIALSMISGFIPAQSAAKKDPAVALRTE
ncbi:MAG: ATP-binding cassette domain-containing protein [Acholeplasmatales bacterium]|jgi:putative ABC transport system permease protein|nr:ATP-binding cassette domain-containing protein [Acholeplasmatales bacterium]